MQMRRSFKPVRFFVGLAILGSFVFAVFNWQNIYDWQRLRGWEPSSKVAQLATDTTMDSKTRRLFYVQRPELNDKTTFNKNCTKSEQTIVLGCYINRQGIFLLSVTEQRLYGVEQVTAAHELLHAAYDRLSSTEKTRINNLINNAFGKITDKRILETVDAYKKDGADINNELHSILGTEIRSLSPELETYYKKYFADRAKIVSYSEKYQKAFSDKKAQEDALYSQIKAIEGQLTGLSDQIQSTESNLNSQYQSLESERNTTTDVQGFNARVNTYNNGVINLRGLINKYNQLANSHNALLEQYNAIAMEEKELFKAIDTRSTQAKTQ